MHRVCGEEGWGGGGVAGCGGVVCKGERVPRVEWKRSEIESERREGRGEEKNSEGFYCHP